MAEVKGIGRQRIIKLQSLILVLSLFFCGVVAIALGAGMSLYSQKTVSAHISRVTNAQLKLFIEHISQDILTGSYSEVHRKCERFIRDSAPESFVVETSDGQILCSFQPEAGEGSSLAARGSVFFDDAKAHIAATVRFVPRPLSLAEFYPEAIAWSIGIAGVCAIILGLLLFTVLSATFRSLSSSLKSISEIGDTTPALFPAAQPTFRYLAIHESQLVIKQFQKLVTTIVGQQDKLAEERARSARADMATQVAHDIRSPLSALNMVIGSLDGMQDEKRLIVRNATQRINDIANNLLHQHVNGAEALNKRAIRKQESILLATLLDSIISEKRVQYRERMQIEIQLKLDGSYGVFVDMQASELARVISNLINNSVESLASRGSVELSVSASGSSVRVRVTDNGSGIAPDILQRIGEKGFTSGKPGGSGLGIFHARQAIESVGGSLSIESKENSGTVVVLNIPRASTPDWFVERICLDEESIVVSVDDDQTVHQVWQERMLLAIEAGAKHVTFSSLEVFSHWLRMESSFENAVFLVDYEFLGQDLNGLEAINRLGIADRAILVTSRYDQPAIVAKAKLLRVRILPKSLVALVPIEFSSQEISRAAASAINSQA